ncbi:MAG: hypothetical protein AAF191_05075 [Verrucomicrobiota bacterium]
MSWGSSLLIGEALPESKGKLHGLTARSAVSKAGTEVRITDLKGGKSVVVRLVGSPKRDFAGMIELSENAWQMLRGDDLAKREVLVTLLTSADFIEASETAEAPTRELGRTERPTIFRLRTKILPVSGEAPDKGHSSEGPPRAMRVNTGIVIQFGEYDSRHLALMQQEELRVLGIPSTISEEGLTGGRMRVISHTFSNKGGARRWLTAMKRKSGQRLEEAEVMELPVP